MLLDRYLIRSLLAIGLFAILVFTISWLAPEIMFNAVQGVSSGKLTLLQGVAYLVYQIPEVLTYCLPISMLFASVFLFRKLSLSGELTAILASGISFRRVLVPIGVVGLGASLLFFLTQEVLMPLASAKLRTLNEVTHFDDKAIVNPQVTFVEKSKSGEMVKFLVITPKALEKQNQFIFLFYQGHGDTTWISRIVTATRGTWNDPRGVWELEDGIEYLLNPDGIYRHVTSFDHRVIRTSPVAHALLSFPTGNPSEFRIKQLEKYVRLLTRGGQTEDAKFYQVRLYQRYVLPWVSLIFTLFGAAIGIERSRSKRNLGLTYAAVLLLVYNILVPVSTTLGSIGILPTFVAALIPVVMAILGGKAIVQLRQLEG